MCGCSLLLCLLILKRVEQVFTPMLLVAVLHDSPQSLGPWHLPAEWKRVKSQCKSFLNHCSVAIAVICMLIFTGFYWVIFNKFLNKQNTTISNPSLLLSSFPQDSEMTLESYCIAMYWYRTSSSGQGKEKLLNEICFASFQGILTKRLGPTSRKPPLHLGKHQLPQHHFQPHKASLPIQPDLHQPAQFLPLEQPGSFLWLSLWQVGRNIICIPDPWP